MTHAARAQAAMGALTSSASQIKSLSPAAECSADAVDLLTLLD